MDYWYKAWRKTQTGYEYVFLPCNPPNPNDEIIDGNDLNGVYDGNTP